MQTCLKVADLLLREVEVVAIDADHSMYALQPGRLHTVWAEHFHGELSDAQERWFVQALASEMPLDGDGCDLIEVAHIVFHVLENEEVGMTH